MLAIHNYRSKPYNFYQVANAFAKLSKCQQFTTRAVQIFAVILLQTLLQSYQNVSNSQRSSFEKTRDGSCKRFCKVIKMLAIQLHIQYNYKQAGCKRFCKVIKMLAIHNAGTERAVAFFVANAFAKLSKCQQFTTIFRLSIKSAPLQTLLQSYQNVSNSQLYFTKSVISASCKRFCKVIKMLAIHNLATAYKIAFEVANAFAKLSKCQQFTTNYKRKFRYGKLQTLLQSYQNVSNSQLVLVSCEKEFSCKRLCKVIKMLAIHNFDNSHKFS